MNYWEKRVLNELINKYERSNLYYKTNRRNQSISIPFNSKKFPEYFNNSSLEYLNINDSMNFLEEKGFITIVWKNKKRNHIISKVNLNIEKINSIYHYLKRNSKSKIEENFLNLLNQYELKLENHPITIEFLSYLRNRITEGKSVKSYIDINNLQDFQDLIIGLSQLEKNQNVYYIREFSIKHFGDSKRFEQLLPRIIKIISNFSSLDESPDKYSTLEEFSVFQNPNYIYLKGNLNIKLKENSINLNNLRQGLAISGEDLASLEFNNKNNVRNVITIENLTTFNRADFKDSLILYLGGFHNKSKRDLIKKIYKTFPEADFLHFGDIDVGGFQIYLDLINKTGIEFQPLFMGIEEMKKYRKYCKVLNKNDQNRLNQLIEKLEISEIPNLINKVLPVLKYMKAENIKLEQEVILISK